MPGRGVEKRGRKPDAALAARRHDEILDAATGWFAEHGYADTDLEEVAAALGVGKGTIYRYFPTKEKLFFAAVDRVMRRVLEEVNAGAAKLKDPLQLISAAIRLHLRFFARHPEAVELLIQERAQFRDRPKPTYFVYQDANIGPWTALLRQLMSAGRVRRIPMSRIVSVVGDLLYGTIFTSHFARRRTNLETQTRDVLDIAFNGMLARREPAR